MWLDLSVFSVTANAFRVPFKKSFLSFELMVTRLWGLRAMFSGCSALGPGSPCFHCGADGFLCHWRLGWVGEGEATPGVLLPWIPIFQEEPSQRLLPHHSCECGRSFNESAEQHVTGPGCSRTELTSLLLLGQGGLYGVSPVQDWDIWFLNCVPGADVVRQGENWPETVEL